MKYGFASIEWLTRTAGIVDNIYGANFNVNPPSADVLDQHGHGTFVAGVIGAVGNNAVGITGVNQVRLLRLPALVLSPNLGALPVTGKDPLHKNVEHVGGVTALEETFAGITGLK